MRDNNSFLVINTQHVGFASTVTVLKSNYAFIIKLGFCVMCCMNISIAEESVQDMHVQILFNMYSVFIRSRAVMIRWLTFQLYVQCISANEHIISIVISADDCGSIEILRSRYGEDRGVA